MERFMELYQSVYKDLYRLAYYYLGNAHDAEDAVSEAVLAAYEGFGKLRREEAFRPWIMKILVNRCRKMRKREGRIQPLGDAGELEQIGRGGQAEGKQLPLSAEMELLETLDILDEEERLLVLLTVFGGYKSREIAKLLNRNHSTVRSRYRRALQKLEKEMQG